MEYALRDRKVMLYNVISFVLILILMEYALRAKRMLIIGQLSVCLNPYSNGIYSMSPPIVKVKRGIYTS